VITVQPAIPASFGRKAAKRLALAQGLSRGGWKVAGTAALLCSAVAWASLPSPADVAAAHSRQWQALSVAPASAGGASGMAMAPTEAVQPLEFVPARAPVAPTTAAAPPAAPDVNPLRIRGRVGDGLYWSLRAAGASPRVTAEYLTALATEIDVGGDVAMGDGFDLVLARGGDLLYAGLDRAGGQNLQLVRWTEAGRARWIDAVHQQEQVETVSSGFLSPVPGRITSYFGYRYHPILHFRRFHAGIDFHGDWGTPIIATADGQVVRAGWAGGYGRQVKLFHGGGMTTSYSHMSQIVAQPGNFVRAGQVIGYVGSSGLSTGPHLHYEVQQNGTPVNPLAVHFASTRIVTDHRVADAVKARLKALLSVGMRRG